MAARKKCDIDLSSEEKIKEAARVVFQKKGYAATRTRECPRRRVALGSEGRSHEERPTRPRPAPTQHGVEVGAEGWDAQAHGV